VFLDIGHAQNTRDVARVIAIENTYETSKFQLL
jgi:hypothetical protein